MNEQHFRRQMDKVLLGIWTRQMMDMAVKADCLTAKPLTRRQKIRRRLSIYSQRISNAWDALRGVDND